MNEYLVCDFYSSGVYGEKDRISKAVFILVCVSILLLECVAGDCDGCER